MKLCWMKVKLMYSFLKIQESVPNNFPLNMILDVPLRLQLAFLCILCAPKPSTELQRPALAQPALLTTDGGLSLTSACPSFCILNKEEEHSSYFPPRVVGRPKWNNRTNLKWCQIEGIVIIIEHWQYEDIKILLTWGFCISHTYILLLKSSCSFVLACERRKEKATNVR